MSKKFVADVGESHPEYNIFADKSSLILEWLLTKGIDKERVSVREVEREVGVSLGLVQKVFYQLVYYGYLKSSGSETKKAFHLEKPKALLMKWHSDYQISKKCRMWSYSSAFENRRELLDALESSKISAKIVRALHSAVPPYQCVNTNLETLELYLPDPDIRSKVEEVLYLEPKGRGYDVLLIQPYYKSMVSSALKEPSSGSIPYTKPLLTFLDLYHFPLRGREQAEYMAGKIGVLKKIFAQKA